ncbi:hypothetical protein ARMSODRAFT_966722 [Armillaria solidipes]|uniref:Heterokaryon incompatibility domain-containing protein n=1 Tax=Armillaria solidipes TaxID=1076256 RepID=A0A2H3ALA7_9AGAR|nr:hypothetical protein ARMSODRAFT_966722 [Armillaria solidipes]
MYVCAEEKHTRQDFHRSEVILSAIAENGQQDSSIPALEQQSSTGGTPVVPFGLTDVPCADLSIDAVLEELDEMVEELDSSATSVMSHNLDEEQTNQAYRLPAYGTLSAFVETGQPESSIPVLKQRSYTGSNRVIPSALANLPCADLGVDAVFEMLNAILGTRHNPTSHKSILGPYITWNYDFGTVYAHLRYFWHEEDIEFFLRDDEQEAQEKERNLLVNGRIKTIYTDCRRVWDLYANRVVPKSTWLNWKPWGISHAWVDERDRVDMWTLINRCEWPVPMPKDANLDLIRIEMLNLGAEYAWLDVLCLRQEGGPREDLRVQEWKIDVPTIGWVYYHGKVVCYFCGLGLPLRLKPGYFEDDRSWFKRAWTLQEISEETSIGGETGNDGTLEEDIQVRFREQLASLRQMRRSHFMFDVFAEMKNRVSTKPLDKVAGLGYILDLVYLPIYDGRQSEEDAWAALVDAMFKYSRWDLLFFYPEPGDGSKCWRPSWNQIMTKILPSQQMSLWDGVFKLREHPDDRADFYQGYHIDSGYVRGLSHPSYKGMPRQGEMVVQDDTGSTHTFKIIADHTYPIPEGSYTLLGSNDHYVSSRSRSNLHDRRLLFWLVGWQRRDGKFEKLSVFSMLDEDERRRIWDLGIGKYTYTVLC